jgi:DNA-binding NarL/FixJ family response regulator
MGHQGAINVESEPGRGTAFWVYLPAEPVVGEQAAATGPEPIGGSARILVIDDEPIITRLLERSLTRLGYAVDVSNSGPEALEAFRAKPDGFDLALVDLIMPDLTGEEIVAELHRIRPGLPVLIMTGSGAAAPHVPSARGHLGKPFTAAKLAAALREALSDDPMPGVNEEALALLSEREKEVARAFYRGQEAAGIAAELFISPNTVQNHFKSIYRKLGVHSRVELLRILRRSTS